MTNKGFSLLEMLLSLLIITSLSLLVLNKVNSIDLEWTNFSNDYLLKQANSLIYKESREVDGYNVRFNENGRVNMAQTISVGNKNIIIHLGTGYITYEE